MARARGVSSLLCPRTSYCSVAPPGLGERAGVPCATAAEYETTAEEENQHEYDGACDTNMSSDTRLTDDLEEAYRRQCPRWRPLRAFLRDFLWLWSAQPPIGRMRAPRGQLVERTWFAGCGWRETGVEKLGGSGAIRDYIAVVLQFGVDAAWMTVCMGRACDAAPRPCTASLTAVVECVSSGQAPGVAASGMTSSRDAGAVTGDGG